MTNLAVFSFDGRNVRFVDGKPVANDVAAILGYSNPAKTVSTKVDPENKGVTKAQTRGGMQSVTVLEEAGVIQLVASSRLPNAIEIARKLGLIVLRPSKEQSTIRIIEAAFADLIPIRQFRVKSYRIDLFLKVPNIAVECDEFGHMAYSLADDQARELAIKTELGCQFVRFNPDSPGFNVGDVIKAIRDLI